MKAEPIIGVGGHGGYSASSGRSRQMRSKSLIRRVHQVERMILFAFEIQACSDDMMNRPKLITSRIDTVTWNYRFKNRCVKCMSSS